ncbi:MAG: DUF4314 domain-containing protein [Anaerovoracaceae bacterium]
MKLISKRRLLLLRKRYPKGVRVRLLRMNDPYTKLEVGALGTVISVDDIGTIHVAWDKGGSLGVVFRVDLCEVVKK